MRSWCSFSARVRLSAFRRCIPISTCVLLVVVSVGCSGATEVVSTLTIQPTPIPTYTGLPSEANLPTPTQPVASPAVLKLRIWLPPQFDPASGTPAGEILRQQMDNFIQQHSGVEIQVRIKALSGPGGLLDSLSASSAAAPLAMPDIVALPREFMEVAALKGLLQPIDNLTEAFKASDWYDYAFQLSYLQDSAFGLPFAGDVLVLVYRPWKILSPPADWAATLDTHSILAFPAADPLALFTVTQYQAGGGVIRDPEGRPFLSTEPLSAVLDYYMQAEQSGLMPFWLTQFQSDDQAWQAFQEERSDMVVTWLSRYLTAVSSPTNGDQNIAFAPLPTLDGQLFTLATGWVWALASPHQEKNIMSVELAEFLSGASFLSLWTESLGYLPPRSNALDNWANVDIQTMLGQVARSAVIYPSTDISTPLGAALQQAVIEVLKKQNDPVSAAQKAADDLTGP